MDTMRKLLLADLMNLVRNHYVDRKAAAKLRDEIVCRRNINPEWAREQMNHIRVH